METLINIKEMEALHEGPIPTTFVQIEPGICILGSLFVLPVFICLLVANLHEIHRMERGSLERCLQYFRKIGTRGQELFATF